MKNTPELSICMATYNHEKYLMKAIDSILNQKVKFDYEIIIGDDASIDSTREMLRAYQHKHPDKIRVILHNKNLGITKNKYTILKRARGRYIAFLDGDDYWTDESKLQKQYDFLENNKEFMGCAAKYNIVDENDDIIVEDDRALDFMMRPYDFENEECTLKDCEKIMAIPSNLSTLFIRNIYKGEGYRYRFLYKIDKMRDDRAIYIFAASHGKICMMNDNVSAYRFVVKKGANNGTSLLAGKNRRAEWYIYQMRLEECVRKKFRCNVDFSNYRNNILIGAVCIWLNNKNKENTKVLWEIVINSYNPVRTVYKIIKIICIKKYRKYIGDESSRITPEIIADKKRG